MTVHEQGEGRVRGKDPAPKDSRLSAGLHQLRLHNRVQYGRHFWLVGLIVWMLALWGVSQNPNFFELETVRTHTLTQLLERGGALWAAVVVARAPLVQEEGQTRAWLVTLPIHPAVFFGQRAMVAGAALVLSPALALAAAYGWAGSFDLAAVLVDGMPPMLFLAGLAMLGGALLGWPGGLALAGSWWLLSQLLGPVVGGDLFLFAYSWPHEGLELDRNRRLLAGGGLVLAAAAVMLFALIWWRSRLTLRWGSTMKTEVLGRGGRRGA